MGVPAEGLDKEEEEDLDHPFSCMTPLLPGEKNAISFGLKIKREKKVCGRESCAAGMDTQEEGVLVLGL